jgi:pimeloyl-ACP methyl ester carboxylesterase/uncharacterized damage-inducible protein DinB
MDFVLIPGLWLDGASWDGVAEPLRWAGHEVHPVTLPGMESADADRSGIDLGDHVDAVVALIDSIPTERDVIVVGHSAGCAIAYAVVDARPSRVRRVVYIGGFPTADGDSIAASFAGEGADVPLPAWDEFDDADLIGLADASREAFRAAAVPSPFGVTSAVQQLTDERRYEVPATVICPEYTAAQLTEWVDAGMEPVRELALLADATYVDLPTGHWPQFTRPLDLTRMLDACTRQQAGVDAVIDEFGRIDPPMRGDEVETLLGFLDYQRATFDRKCIGLDADGLAVTVGVSSMTLGGLIKHMALVEDHWFSCSLHDNADRDPFGSVDWEADPDWEWRTAADDSPGELATLWHSSVNASRRLTDEALAADGFDTAAKRSGSRGTVNLRWIVAHMIEEYARHNGHADLLREVVDGATGE